MKRTAGLALGMMLIVCSSLLAQPARTFAASTGNDANPCSLSAPCRSLQAAFNAVAAHGEVIALDSAGYGVLSMNHSASIIAPNGVYAGITGGSGGAGVVVNMAIATDSAVLRGLNINGAQSAFYGVHFQGDGNLYVEACTISSTLDAAILVQPNQLYDRVSIKDSTIRDCLFGVNVGAFVVSVDSCRIENCNQAIRSLSPGCRVAVRNSVFDTDGVALDLSPLSGGPASVAEVENCLMEHGTTSAITADATSAPVTISVSNTMIVLGYHTIAVTGGAQVKSFGNNKVVDNTFGESFTGSIVQQ